MEKNPLKSKTIWGALMSLSGLIAIGLNLFFKTDLEGDEIKQVVIRVNEFWEVVVPLAVSLFGSVMAIVGRFKKDIKPLRAIPVTLPKPPGTALLFILFIFAVLLLPACNWFGTASFGNGDKVYTISAKSPVAPAYTDDERAAVEEERVIKAILERTQTPAQP